MFPERIQTAVHRSTCSWWIKMHKAKVRDRSQDLTGKLSPPTAPRPMGAISPTPPCGPVARQPLELCLKYLCRGNFPHRSLDGIIVQHCLSIRLRIMSQYDLFQKLPVLNTYTWNWNTKEKAYSTHSPTSRWQMGPFVPSPGLCEATDCASFHKSSN